MRRISLTLALAVFLAGCSDQAPDPPRIEGAWEGITSSGLVFTFMLGQSETTVSGTGLVEVPGEGTFALDVSGSYVTPLLSLTVTSADFEPFNYTGTHTKNTVDGRLNGSGFQDRPLVIWKQ